ncbi:MAG: spermidine/putrescine ABC transporter substrate-binding protein [Endomicrobium sp.]|jgi:spermidine/putrescine-binding protein|nr:spermidine/putrescine ABC transporter substrate-binding protein [Endomicrobium sp.]
MKKAVLFAVAVLVLSGAIFTKAQAEGRHKSITVFTWAGAFDSSVIKDFYKKTGYRINYVNFDLDETMYAKLKAAKGGDYDVIIADDYIIETAIAEGLVDKLDKSKLKNYGNINPLYQGQFYDKTDEYTIPYAAGILSIVYDPALTKVDIQGYGDLWDPSLKNNVGIVGAFRDIDGVALKTLGYSFNDENIEHIKAAGEKLKELAPNIRLIKDDNMQDDLLSGEIAAGIMYTSQVTLAKLAKPSLKLVFPKEGIGFGIMAAFIPVNAPNKEAAHAFLDVLLDAQNAKKNLEYIGYYSANTAADPLISPKYKEFLTLPKEFSQDQMEMIQNISPEAEAEHQIIWTEFKKATGRK